MPVAPNSHSKNVNVIETIDNFNAMGFLPALLSQAKEGFNVFSHHSVPNSIFSLGFWLPGPTVHTAVYA